MQIELDDPKLVCGPDVQLRYRIKRPSTGTVVTHGTFTVRYEREPDAGIPPSPAGEDSTRLLLAPLELRRLELEDIAKGDEERFAFRVTQSALRAFTAMLREGLSGARPALDALQSETRDAEGYLGIALFSTLVGMRLPGESAAFLDFSADVGEQLRRDRVYELRGRVAHASRSTRIVRTDIAIGPLNGGGDDLISGRVAVLVSKPARARTTVSDLRRDSTDFGLADKVVLVTGASRGIGETTAKLFALFGARVVVNFRRSRAEAERIVQEIAAEGGRAIAVQADVADAAQVRAMVDGAAAELGGIDILVNNAVRDFKSIAYSELDWDQVQADIDVTVKGAFNCCKAVTPYMQQRGAGKIINILSVYADDPPPDQLKYVISKAALGGLTRGLAAELVTQNIQVNAVVPSFVDTEIASQLHEGIRRQRAEHSPMSRNATPADVAQAVLFLASSFCSYTTGQRLLVTGGGAPYL